ncbi:unnamed protein product [Gadus morhua 'NCC']
MKESRLRKLRRRKSVNSSSHQRCTPPASPNSGRRPASRPSSGEEGVREEEERLKDGREMSRLAEGGDEDEGAGAEGKWLMGLGFFLFPGASSWLREWYLPLHAFFGLFLLAVSIATCLTGITEKLLFSIMETYSLRAPEGLLANSLALLLLLFGGLVGFIVTREEFRRPPQPEEEALSVHFTSLTPSSP